MVIAKEEFYSQIQESAKKRIKESLSGISYIAREQGDVETKEKDDIEDYITTLRTQRFISDIAGIAGLTSQLRELIFEESRAKSLTDKSDRSPDEKPIPNQEELASILLGEYPKLIYKLAEIKAKTQIFINLLNQQKNEETKDIEDKAITWDRTINNVVGALCKDKQGFQQLVEEIVEKLREPSERRFVNKKDGEIKKIIVESYVSRLEKLVKKCRSGKFISRYLDYQQGETLVDNLVDEYLETAFILNTVRVLDRIQRPLEFNAKFRKLTSCLEGSEIDPTYSVIIDQSNLRDRYEDYINKLEEISNSGLGEVEERDETDKTKKGFKEECRKIIEGPLGIGTIQDERIDIIDTRNKIQNLYSQAEEITNLDLDTEGKKRHLIELDQQIVILLIPIANKVARLFPHYMSTNLTEVLSNEEAICAGKVNILLAISKYLGINARANSVSEHLNNDTSGHVCYECDLPSGAKLVIDANFGNALYLDGKSEEDLLEEIKSNNPGITGIEIQSQFRYTLLATENARYINHKSRVLIYTAEFTGSNITSERNQQEVKNRSNLFIRVNPYTGQNELWKASIPHPHLITLPDKDGYLHINSSFTNNTGIFLGNKNDKLGIYLFKKQIEMNPYNPKSYIYMAELLPEGQDLVFYEKIKKEKPNLYWGEISVSNALLHAERGDLELASKIFEETKLKNPSAYYKKLYLLVQQYRDKANEMAEEESVRLNTEACEIMDRARNSNPSLFYSTELNVLEIIEAYQDQPDKKIEIYEQFMNTQEKIFWDTKEYSPPFEILMKLYIEQAKIDLNKKSRAIEFLKEIKSKQPTYYAKKVHSYVFPLLLSGERKDPQQAVLLMDNVRKDSKELFFQNPSNVFDLALAYQNCGDTMGAIELLEESKDMSASLFWNNGDQPIYEELVALYRKSNQPKKAIKVCEEAKNKSGDFWRYSYTRGYSQLAKLYAENNMLGDAISLCLDAKEKDQNFFNPKLSEAGYILLALLYSQNGQLDKAVEIMQEGEKKDEYFWKESFSLANAFILVNYLEKSKRTQEAIDVLEKLKEKNHEYWKTDYYRICDLYQQIGKEEKSTQTRSELVKIYEGLKTSNNSLYFSLAEKIAQVYIRDSKKAEAIKVLEEGIENNPFFHIKGIITLAELYSQTQELEKARLTYQKALERTKRNGIARYTQSILDSARNNGIELNI